MMPKPTPTLWQDLLLTMRRGFKSAFGRDPTPSEIYLMHQQGLGFYTRGALTNIKGNPYPGMRGPQTSESFEQGWARELQSRIERARAAQGGRALSNEQIAGFLSNTPTAEQSGNLSGGLSDTPIAAAQTAALMTETPIDQIKAATALVNRAAVRGSLANKPGQVPTRVAASRETTPVEGYLPTRVSQTPTLPIPGVDTPSAMRQMAMDLSGPSTVSTAMAYPASQPQPKVEGPGFLQRVMDAVRGMAVAPNLSPSPNAAKSVADILDTLKTNPLPGSAPNVQSAWQGIDESPLGQGAQGLVAGMTHMPTDLISTLGAMGLNTGGLLFNSPGMKQAGYDVGQWGDAKRQEALKLQKIDPNAMTPTQKSMEWVGQNISPTLPATLLSGATSMLGQYVTGPLGQKIGQNFPIPSLGDLNPFDTRPAQAATAFGRPPTIINTPGGPVALNDEELSGMIAGGALTLGFGASLSKRLPCR